MGGLFVCWFIGGNVDSLLCGFASLAVVGV